MKDLIKVIKRYCRRDVYNQDDYVLNEEDFTTIAEYVKEQEKPLLGLATTRELLNEIKVRIEVDGNLDYRTVDE